LLNTPDLFLMPRAGAHGSIAKDRRGALARLARQWLGRLHQLSSRSISGRRNRAPAGGMSREYLTKTIDDFRSRVRGNNPGMSDLMLATSPDDLTALEEYLAGR
jgi:hypothetical protein